MEKRRVRSKLFSKAAIGLAIVAAVLSVHFVIETSKKAVNKTTEAVTSGLERLKGIFKSETPSTPKETPKKQQEGVSDAKEKEEKHWWDEEIEVLELKMSRKSLLHWSVMGMSIAVLLILEAKGFNSAVSKIFEMNSSKELL